MKRLLLLLLFGSIAWSQSCPAGYVSIAQFSVRTANDSVIPNICLNSTTGQLRTTSDTDGAWNVPLGSCGINATTGALAAAGTVAGTNPGPLFVAANNFVLQAVTTAAANVLKLDCDITPPARSTAGRGINITSIQVFYGVQTTALTSITAPTLSTVTFAATGGGAQGTVAAFGGTLAVTPGTLQLATTTTGQCYSENISLGTPIFVNTDLQRITVEQIFNQTGAAATTLQICGIRVYFTNAIL